NSIATCTVKPLVSCSAAVRPKRWAMALLRCTVTRCGEPVPRAVDDAATCELNVYTEALVNSRPVQMAWSCSARVCCGGETISSCSCLNSLASSRSEEHTSELQSRFDLVCRLLLEKKNNNI